MKSLAGNVKPKCFSANSAISGEILSDKAFAWYDMYQCVPSECLILYAVIKAWATANMLKLNDNMTELMLVTSKRTKHLHSLPT